MISCILLSAGYSSRFGSPKALANLCEKTVIEQLQENLVASFVDEVVVVLGACAQNIQPFILKHKKVKAVYNKDYNFGQTSSVQSGVAAVKKQAKGIMVLPVDFSFIKTDTFNAMTEFFSEERPTILIPTHQGRKGHPPIFAISLKSEILGLNRDSGLNKIAHDHPKETCFCPVEDRGVVLTFNTKEEFEEIKKAI